ncbi:hypothetical protein ACE1ET_13070 [Saccharicrinis sp. FJH62]|uniref:hypothetical protein n=1 Tax=Saccharicrinis sp. FJH62 TaxID=3344657 RepID=UPI0035D4077B
MMIHTRFKLNTLILLLMLLIPLGLMASGIEETLITVRSYKVDPDTKLEVFNKYGTIHINTWQKDSVIIKASEYYKAEDKKQLDKLKSSVDFTITKTRYIINVKTVFSDPAKDLLNFIPLDLKSNTETKVDLEIWMPEAISLTLEHRYGDVFIGTMTGDAFIDVAHGQFKAYNMFGKLKLNAAYCNSTIRFTEDAIISARFGEMTLDSAGKINIESRSADIVIGEANLLEINGRNDDIYIQSCDELHLDGYFSKLNADEISGNVYSKTTYGNLNLNFPEHYENSITIYSNYTDIGLTFAAEDGMLPVSILHQKSRFMYSSSNTHLKEEKISGKDVIYKSTGTIGTGGMLNGNLSVEMFSGELKLIVK